MDYYDDYEYERDREEWEAERRELDMYEDRALQETLEDAARENCYADYSGGKKPTMRCDYNAGSNSTNVSGSQESAAVGGVIALIIIAVVAYMVFRPKKGRQF